MDYIILDVNKVLLYYVGVYIYFQKKLVMYCFLNIILLGKYLFV